MTGITELLFDNDDYADEDDALDGDLDLFFFDTCIIFASLPSHSATSLGAVLPYVQCVCFPDGFWSFMFWSVFVLQAFAVFGESGM